MRLELSGGLVSRQCSPRAARPVDDVSREAVQGARWRLRKRSTTRSLLVWFGYVDSSRSLQGNAVPPQPIVHRPDVASERRRDIFGTSVLLEIQVPKASLGEEVTVLDSGRSHPRPHFMQPLVNRGDPHVESLRDFANRGTPVVQALDDLAREGQPVTMQLPTFPRLPDPSEDRHVVRGRPPLNFYQFRNGTAREPVLVESHGACPDQRRVGSATRRSG